MCKVLLAMNSGVIPPTPAPINKAQEKDPKDRHQVIIHIQGSNERERERVCVFVCIYVYVYTYVCLWKRLSKSLYVYIHIYVCERE